MENTGGRNPDLQKVRNSVEEIRDGYKKALNKAGDDFADSIVSPFNDGVAVAGKDNFYFLVDEKGKKIGAKLYDDVQMPSEGKIGVKVGSKWHFIDKTGKDLKFGEYDEIYPFYGGIAGVRIGRYWRFIKADGSKLNDKTYDKVEDFDTSDGTAAGRRNGRWITINRRGEEVES